MQLNQLIKLLDDKLEVWRFQDYAPNGLQIAGKDEVVKILAGVSASQALIDAAVAQNVDAILVHHGYFWKGEASQIVGIKKQRIKTLLANDISLIAYHLPLDAHAELGNNAQLAKLFNWQMAGVCGEQNLLCHGTLAMPLSAADLSKQISQRLKRSAQLFGDASRQVKRIAWCSGGSQSFFSQAIELGVDAFVCGEASEQHFHLAMESGVAFIAAGHHATERGGICALANWLNEQEDLQVSYLELENPI